MEILFVLAVLVYLTASYGMMLFAYDEINKNDDPVWAAVPDKLLAFVVVLIGLLFPVIFLYTLLQRAFKGKTK